MSEPVSPHVKVIDPDSRSMTYHPASRQVGGDHYQSMKIQPHAYITANELCWEAANIVKYASRAGRKGDAQTDIQKVIHYAELWLERLEEEE